jgi:hypothetical protein
MVPSIRRPRGASPKPTWRQTQAGVAPNPNPCQLFPIATHCRFEPFQGLGRPRKRHPLAAPCRSSVKTHTIVVLFKTIQIPPNSQSQPGDRADQWVTTVPMIPMIPNKNFYPPRSPCRPSTPRQAAPSYSDHCSYVGIVPILARDEANIVAHG